MTAIAVSRMPANGVGRRSLTGRAYAWPIGGLIGGAGRARLRRARAPIRKINTQIRAEVGDRPRSGARRPPPAPPSALNPHSLVR
jgi:hypothetical protein